MTLPTKDNWQTEFDEKYNGEWCLESCRTEHDELCNTVIKSFISSLLSKERIRVLEGAREAVNDEHLEDYSQNDEGDRSYAQAIKNALEALDQLINEERKV